jgi:hypothetical protein
MEIIKHFKERRLAQKKEAIVRMAEDTIRLSDFDGTVYIAYNGDPLIPMNPLWSSKDIIGELNKLRSNFINSRMKDNGIIKIAAVL